MELNGFLGAAVGTFVLIVLVPFLCLGLAIPYAILRLRENREDRADPQVGLKVALYYFFSVGIILFLLGMTVIVVDLMLEEDRQARGAMARVVPAGQGLNQTQRIGLGLIVAGLVVALLHLALVKSMTNDRNSLTARRIFAGWRFAIHGIVIVVAFTVLTAVLFQRDFGDRSLRKSMFGILLIWVPSWVLHLILLGVYSRQLYEPPRHREEWPPREPPRPASSAPNTGE